MKHFLKKSLTFLLLAALFTGALSFPSRAATGVNPATLSGSVGIDVSKYNGVIDWEAVAQLDLDFVMIKTGDGSEPVSGDFSEDVDSQFETNYTGAGEIGIRRGVYHVCSVRTPEEAVKNAEYCLKILNGRTLEYPVAYDIELDGSFAGGKENTTAIAKAFCETIAAAGYVPMIYTSADHAKNDFNWEELSDYKVWIAAYTGELSPEGKDSFSPSCDIWQFTKSGDVTGANTNNGKGFCDLNYSYMEAQGIRYKTKAVTLGIKETYTPAYTLTPANTTDSISFQSSDKSVASVSKTGKITAKATGTAVITATCGSGVTTSITVKVKKAPTKVKLSVSTKTLRVGKSYTTKVTFSSGAFSNKLTFTSSKSSVASVSKAGKITAKKKGSATITVTTYNKKTAKIKVTVK
jgi:GH25 family lysozyme M1 (1,4-beta-N-acetylmuramidase)